MNQAEWNEPKRQRMNHTDRIHTHRKLKTTWQDEMFYFGVFLRTPALFAAVRVEFSRCWHGFCVDLATKVPWLCWLDTHESTCHNWHLQQWDFAQMRSEEFVKRNAAGNLTFGKDPAATVIFYSHCLKIKHGVMTSCSDTNTGQIYYIIHPVLPTHTHTIRDHPRDAGKHHNTGRTRRENAPPNTRHPPTRPACERLNNR